MVSTVSSTRLVWPPVNASSSAAAVAFPGIARAAPVAADSWKNRRREPETSSNLSSSLMGVPHVHRSPHPEQRF